jgi:hypothetical protein
MNEQILQTYAIGLCKNGHEFKVIPNVANVDFRGRPMKSETIDEKWRVLGVISNSPNKILVDVEEVTQPVQRWRE